MTIIFICIKCLPCTWILNPFVLRVLCYLIPICLSTTFPNPFVVVHNKMYQFKTSCYIHKRTLKPEVVLPFENILPFCFEMLFQCLCYNSFQGNLPHTTSTTLGYIPLWLGTTFTCTVFMPVCSTSIVTSY